MGSARTYPERTRLGDDGIYPACWANFKGGPPQEPWPADPLRYPGRRQSPAKKSPSARETWPAPCLDAGRRPWELKSSP